MSNLVISKTIHEFAQALVRAVLFCLLIIDGVIPVVAQLLQMSKIKSRSHAVLSSSKHPSADDASLARFTRVKGARIAPG